MSETISVQNMSSPSLSLEFSCIELVSNSMNNPLSYCGLVDAKISSSDKDLTVNYKVGCILARLCGRKVAKKFNWSSGID